MNPIEKQSSFLLKKKTEVLEDLKTQLDTPGVREWCYQATMNQHYAHGHVNAPLAALREIVSEAKANAGVEAVLGLSHRVFWVTGEDWRRTAKAARALASVVWFAYHGGFRSFDYARSFYALDELDLTEFGDPPNVLVEDFRISDKGFFNERFGLWLRDRAQYGRITFLSLRPDFPFDKLDQALGECYRDILDSKIVGINL